VEENRNMNRICLLFGLLASLCVVAVIAGPVRSEEPAIKPDDSKRMVELLDKIEKRLASQQAQSDILMDIVRKDLKDLREEVARLQRELGDLRRTPTVPSTSNYPQSPSAGYAPSTSYSMTTPAAPANVRLINTYFTDMTAVVNGVAHTVPPGQVAVVPVPAGVLNYHVLQAPYPPQLRTLTPNETLTLTLR
jgi:hypothetical protein